MKKIKVYRTNATLGHQQYVYLIRLNKNKNGYDYLVIDRYDIDDIGSYPLGGTVHNLEDLYVDVIDYNITDSPLYRTYLFDYFLETCDDIEYVEEGEEKTIPITLGMIRETCGWSKYCDITGGNHYMLNEYSVSDREQFDVKRTDAKKLGFIK